MIKTKKISLAIPAEAAAMPEKPKIAAINATTRKVKAHPSMFASFAPVNPGHSPNSSGLVLFPPAAKGRAVAIQDRNLSVNYRVIAPKERRDSMSKNTIIGVVVAVVVGFIAIVAIQESNKSPFEKAGEQLDDAADEFSDAVDDATN